MTEHSHKVNVGIFIIVAHFAVILLVAAVSVLGGIDFPETTTSIALIAPMFAIYTTAIVKYIVDNQAVTKDTSPKVTKPFVFISYFIPSLFICFLSAIIILRGSRVWIRDPEMYKYLLGSAETIFGVYVGIILRSMFEIRPQNIERARD